MTRRASSYPHPVLGCADDVAGTLTCDLPVVDVGATATHIAVTNIRCTNSSIQAAVTSGAAAFVLTYRCPATALRDVATGRTEQINAQLQNAQLYGRVELSLHICAVKELIGWAPAGLNVDYAGSSFTLEPGALLALGPEFGFRVGDEFEPPEGSIASIFSVVRTAEKSAPARLNFESDGRIKILLSEMEHDQFNRSRNSLAGLIHAGLVYPALVEAIDRVNRSVPGDEEKSWHVSLSALIAGHGAEELDAFSAASQILNRPFERSSVEVQALVTGEADE